MTIFLDTKMKNTKKQQCARENVHRIAAEIERTYCPLPDFQVNFYKTIPNYWRAFKESCGAPDFLVEIGYDSMMVDAELLKEETEKLPLAFEWQTTLHFSPSVWPHLATLPPTGVRTEAQWIVVLIFVPTSCCTCIPTSVQCARYRVFWKKLWSIWARRTCCSTVNLVTRHTSPLTRRNGPSG